MPPRMSEAVLPGVKVAAVTSGQFVNVTPHGRSVIDVPGAMALKASWVVHGVVCAIARAASVSEATNKTARFIVFSLWMRQGDETVDHYAEGNDRPVRARLNETGRERRNEIAFAIEAFFDGVRQRNAEIVGVDGAEIDGRIRVGRLSDELEPLLETGLTVVALHEFPPQLRRIALRDVRRFSLTKYETVRIFLRIRSRR